MCAQAADTEAKPFFSVSSEINGALETAPYADMNDDIYVCYVFAGRTTGEKYKAKEMGRFSIPDKFVSDHKFYACVFKIDACFGNSEEKKLCFAECDGFNVNSIAFIKTENFIY